MGQEGAYVSFLDRLIEAEGCAMHPGRYGLTAGDASTCGGWMPHVGKILPTAESARDRHSLHRGGLCLAVHQRGCVVACAGVY